MIGSLFSGIGGLELGLERSGLAAGVEWQVEINPHRRRILAKHWPFAERYNDVRGFRPNFASGPADLICGGFPCQDVSDASRGRGGGINGSKSGLWKEFARIVGESKPRVVVVENVAGAARKKWLPTVRRDLHLLGYRTRALRLDARDVGAPHARPRIFVVGYSDAKAQPARPVDGEVAWLPEPAALGRHWREPPPESVRMDDGLPEGLDRLAALGDAVVPQCAEVVGYVIQRDLLLEGPR